MARLRHRILPLLLFVLHSPEHMLCYGKRLMARRVGLDEIHSCHSAMLPDARVVETYANGLERFAGQGS